jgi:hypothetical protein
VALQICIFKILDATMWRAKTIYYLHETWINWGHTKEKIWQDLTIRFTKDAFWENFQQDWNIIHQKETA